jgi:hypothetical protein
MVADRWLLPAIAPKHLDVAAAPSTYIRGCTRHHAAARHYLPLLIDSYPFVGATHNNTHLASAISRPLMTYRNKKLR